MHAKQIIAGYLILQAVGIAAWWSMLLLVPISASWFQPETWPSESLLGFWLADAVLLIGGSVAAAGLVLFQRGSATTVIWCLAGVAWYPALYCVGVSIITDEAWAASALMAGLTLAMATIQGGARQEPATIRVTPMRKATAVGWTLTQTLIFWSVFLWILPKGIVEVEERLGWENFTHPYQKLAAASLFLAASVLGLASGVTMAACGEGTPLPTATTPKLVAVGAYRFVRNPMAVAGIMQGIGVGWWLGSSSVIAYSITGAFVWHIFVRPVEEADLQARFGNEYSRYRQVVGLWVPRPRSRSLRLERPHA